MRRGRYFISPTCLHAYTRRFARTVPRHPQYSQKHPQDLIHRLSLAQPEAFWSHQARELHWHKEPTAALRTFERRLPDGTAYPSWEWFPGGEISTCYNCVDRHVKAGNGAAPAIFFDSPVTDTKRRITYADLLDEVDLLAGVLRRQGVRRGDVVLIYMPVIPAAIIGMLAINRLGAIHAVVFGGFAPPALAKRIDSCRPVVILTASAGVDGVKPPTPYRPLVREALRIASHKPSRVLVWERRDEHPKLAVDGMPWQLDCDLGERCWQTKTREERDNRAGGGVGGVGGDQIATVECVTVDSSDPIYVMHTSGTTGEPKGVVRDSGGHAVGLHATMAFVYGIRGPGDVVFVTSDIGWVLGHSYVIYGPLLRGAATVLYEGKPVGTPDASALWRIAEEYGVGMMFSTPTALRAVSKSDPDHAFLKTIARRGGLSKLRGLFLAGERSEPSIITRYQTLLARNGAPHVPVIDNWWSTELASPVTCLALEPYAVAGLDALGIEPLGPSSSPTSSPSPSLSSSSPPLPVRLGSAGKAIAGFDFRVVNDAGKEVAPGETGNVVLALPLAPTAVRTLWQDEERFYRSYLARFGGKWFDTGDEGFVSEDGYLHVMSRNDDVLNVSAYRLSSGAIEQSITSHPLVAEAYVVGIPDPLKGQRPFAFIVTTDSSTDGDAGVSSVPESPSSLESLDITPTSVLVPPKLFSEIQQRVRSNVGAIASLGGALLCPDRSAIPRTRSGKTLRKVLREALEIEALAAGEQRGQVDETKVEDNVGAGQKKKRLSIKVPDTVEDAGTVEIVQAIVKAYFEGTRGDKDQTADNEKGASNL